MTNAPISKLKMSIDKINKSVINQVVIKTAQITNAEIPIKPYRIKVSLVIYYDFVSQSLPTCLFHPPETLAP